MSARRRQAHPTRTSYRSGTWHEPHLPRLLTVIAETFLLLALITAVLVVGGIAGAAMGLDMR